MCFEFAATPRANHMVLEFLETRLVLEQDQAPVIDRTFSIEKQHC